ncbi:MAG: SIS domain-containing protein [Candidatus Izemoplasmatales bacterium]
MNYYMEKEIFQQKECLINAYQINLKTFEIIAKKFKEKEIKSVIFAARGSSDNSGVLFKYLFETICKIPVSFAAPSVLTLYKSNLDYSSSLVIGVSQSGQAQDVLAIIEEANRQKAMTITITNYIESPLGKAGSYHLFLDTGEEKSVAATKTFMTQMYLLGLLVGYIDNNHELIKSLVELPEKLDISEEVLTQVKTYASEAKNIDSAFILGRGYQYAIAKEFALKMQETTYIQALSYSIADFYHGPFAMISENSYSVVLMPEDESYQDGIKMLSALQKAGSKVLVITTNKNLDSSNKIVIPEVTKYQAPFVNIFVAQYFCLHLALARGLNPDEPRGLRKVTITR